MDQKKGKSRIRGIIILVLLAVMLVSGAMSIRSWMEDKRTREEYERLAGLARETTAQRHGSREPQPGPRRSRRQSPMYLPLILKS